jgi:hypothetical protein
LTDVFSAKLALLGEIVMAVNPSTVKFAVPFTPFSVQVIATGPFDTPVTTFPLIVATLVADDVQAHTVASGSVVPSLKVPIACIASIEPTATPTLAGMTAIEASVAELTDNGADPVTPPNVAEIVVDPAFTPVAMPMLPEVLLIVAAAVLLAQTASCVMFCVLASLKVPIAVKACVVSGGIVVVDGTTTIDEIVAVVTFSVAVPLNEPSVAVIVDDPPPTPSARPGVVGNVAAAVFDEVQVAEFVTLCLLPSL